MIERLYCHFCGKCVSTAFKPESTDTPDKGLIIRAIIVCPECIERKRVIIPDIDKSDKADRCKHGASRCEECNFPI